jgi:AcrR family transcriptional regulator
MLILRGNPTVETHSQLTEHGVNASMRDIARRADVGLATLLRHFPTREALYEELLLYESGRTDAEGRRTRNGEFT